MNEHGSDRVKRKPKELKKTFYIKYVKRILDIMLSAAGLILLSPVYLISTAAIRVDSEGPIIFRQKRFGKDKKFFMIYKFRTMRTDAPQNVPTHLMGDPEQWLTGVGRVLRRTSIDELPQLWNILRGDMSIIGPRPALWNQEDLIAERDKYDANSVLPGLTGWAQINGRDELPISEKARMDGEYVRKLSLVMDLKCFLGTISCVLTGQGIKKGNNDSSKQ